MTTIYKYPVPIQDVFTLDLPDEFTILTAQVQNGSPYLWIVVDPSAPTKPRKFRLVGTGHPFKDAAHWAYIATLQLANGGLVFHLFF